MVICRSIVYIIITTIPILFAAVQAWVWSIYSALIFAAFLLLLWRGGNQKFWVSNRIFIITLGIFFASTLSQHLPLQSSILSLLSPFRKETLSVSNDLLSNSLSWITLSYFPLNSFSWWIFLLSALLFFFVLRQFFNSRSNLKLLVGIMIGLTIAEAIYGLIQALVPSLGVLWVDYISNYLGTARGTYINRNHFAGLIEMVWPVALGYTMALSYRGKEINLRKLLASDRLNKQILLVLGMAVVLLALLLSRSRAGIMGAFIGFLTFVLLSRSSEKRLPPGIWIVSGAMIGLVFLYGIKIGFDPIIKRFLLINEGDSRLSIWRDSLVILKDHPLGIGLGNFRHVFPVYNISNISDTRFLYAHNDYLQLLVEAGIPGFLALASGFFIFLGKSFKMVKRMKPRHDPLRFFLAVGALSGIVSLAFHSFVDFNLHMPANLIYFVTLIAIVHTCAWRSADFTDRTIDKIRSADYADFRRLRNHNSVKNQLEFTDSKD